jgi:hypothetical protein
MEYLTSPKQPNRNNVNDSEQSNYDSESYIEDDDITQSFIINIEDDEHDPSSLNKKVKIDTKFKCKWNPELYAVFVLLIKRKKLIFKARKVAYH